MRKVNAVIWHVKKKDGYPIRIRVWEKDKYVYYNTSLFLNARKLFNPKTGLVRESHEDYIRFNSIIKDNIKRFSVEHTSTDSFKDYLKEHVESLYRAKNFGNANKFSVLYNHLNAFRPTDIQFLDITPSFVRKFKQFLQSNNLRDTTIQIYINKFKRIYYLARADKKIVGENVFENFPNSAAPTHSKALSREVFEKFRDAFVLGGNEERWRDENLFLFYCNGMRVGDAILLQYKSINDGKIVYRMRKTDKVKEVRLGEDLVNIILKFMPDEFIYNLNGCDMPLDKSMNGLDFIKYYAEQFPNHYILPYLNNCTFANEHEKYKKVQSVTSIWNLHLKKVCWALSIDRFSSHQIRHTFATLFLEEMGDLRALSTLMAHANLKITINYIKSLNSETVADMSDDFYKKLNKKNSEIIVEKKPSSNF